MSANHLDFHHLPLATFVAPFRALSFLFVQSRKEALEYNSWSEIIILATAVTSLTVQVASSIKMMQHATGTYMKKEFLIAGDSLIQQVKIQQNRQILTENKAPFLQ